MNDRPYFASNNFNRSMVGTTLEKGTAMRRSALIVLSALSLPLSGLANAQNCVFPTVNASLKADADDYKSLHPDQPAEKGGLVERESNCPPSEQAGFVQYVVKSQRVSISKALDAVLMDTEQCGGGNTHGQYLVVLKGGVCKLVTDPEIGDMHFLAHEIHAADKSVTLNGVKWTRDDPHCCPSEHATLNYDVLSGSYSFTLRELKK